MIGEKVLNYQIDSLIGEGGVGKVYLASHLQLGRKVAIKALNPGLVDNQEVRQRFRNEAATLSSLQHLNIVTLYDYVEEEKDLFLIMEYVDGLPLNKYIKDVSGPIPEDKAIKIFNQILDGMAYAHKQDIIHRDIKPSNIILGTNGEIKILDFGIAKILGHQQSDITKTGAKVGTVLYMSPEQVKGKTMDKRTDIYALGLTLFQILTGKPAYDQEQMTEYEIYEQIVKSPLPRAKDFYPNVSDKMQSIIDKATSKEPENRFQSCEEFAEALKGEIVVAPAIPEHNEDIVIDDTEPRRRSSSWILILGLVMVAGLITTLVFWNPFEQVDEETDLGIDTNYTAPPPDTIEENFYDDEAIAAEKAKDPDRILLDSLKDEKEKREESVKAYYDERNGGLMDNLIVDGQFIDNELGEFNIQVTLVNKSEEIKFDDLTILITYFDNSGNQVETLEYPFGTLDLDKTESFPVNKEVDASEFKLELLSAEPTFLEEPEVPDSLETLEEEIEELEDLIKKQDSVLKVKEEKKYGPRD